jgi:hypothetical protein
MTKISLPRRLDFFPLQPSPECDNCTGKVTAWADGLQHGVIRNLDAVLNSRWDRQVPLGVKGSVSKFSYLSVVSTSFNYFEVTKAYGPIPRADRFNARVCGRPLAGIPGSNLAGGGGGTVVARLEVLCVVSATSRSLV